MSVICGYLSFDRNKSPLSIGDRMLSSISGISVDKIERWDKNNIFLSCHHQFITPESVNEVLPYYDSESGIAMVANAIIDNREDLFRTFSIPSCEWDQYTDSRLILSAYKRWGEECPKYLLGDYAFAIYDEKAGKLVCSRDHTGRATLYYSMKDSFFAFCSIMKPLICINDDKELNEQWITDFLSDPTVMSEIDISITAYRAISQLQPAHTLVLNNERLTIKKYWDPLRSPKIRFKTDEEYDEAFLNVITEATNCKLRSIGEIGISLSGGLDSSTVAGISARLLRDRGKILRSYTSIPMEGYIERFGKNVISDESAYVKEIAGMYPNIKTAFCRAEGKDSFHDIDKYLDIIEQPYKTVENLFWNVDILEKARHDKCKVLLNGQFGNITISHGDYLTYFHTLLCTGRFWRLFNEIQMFSQHSGIGRRKIAKMIIGGAMPLISRLFFHDDVKLRFTRSFSLANPLLADKYNEEKRLDEAELLNKRYRTMTLKAYRRMAINHPTSSQVAAFENRLGFHYGIVTRDPTKDKRVIEFCFNLPGNQYIRDGRNKVILRRTTKGIIPDSIRLNYIKSGVQAADWLQRLIPFWNDISCQLKERLNDDRIKQYLNTQAIYNYLNENEELKLNMNPVDVRQIIIAYIFSEFILNQGKGGLEMS